MNNADKTQAIANSEWWQAVCKLVGARLISFTERIGATVQFPKDAFCQQFDGRVAAYIIAQADEREAFNQRVLKDLKKILKDFRAL